jgi:hypothetical protein
MISEFAAIIVTDPTPPVAIVAKQSDRLDWIGRLLVVRV